MLDKIIGGLIGGAQGGQKADKGENAPPPQQAAASPELLKGIEIGKQLAAQNQGASQGGSPGGQQSLGMG